MKIRKASTEDCEELTELRIAMRQERECIPAEELAAFRRDTCLYLNEALRDHSFIAFVAEENGELTASSGLCLYRVPPTFENRSGLVAYIMNMYTKPNYRRRGIAGQLLECLMHEANEQGCTKLTLYASEMGKPLYLRHGFQLSDNHMEYVYICI